MQFLFAFSDNDSFQVSDEFVWFTNGGSLPPDEPSCGFENNQCKEPLSKGILATVVVVPLLILLALCIVAGFALVKFRHYYLHGLAKKSSFLIFCGMRSSCFREIRKDYNPLWWRFRSDEVVLAMKPSNSFVASHKNVVSTKTTQKDLQSKLIVKIL